MKLKKLETGQGLVAKLKLGAAGLLMRERPADILRVLLYRPKFFGKPFSEWTQELLRGHSSWSVGERELMAAMVSRTNECKFCLSAHSQMAAKMMGEETVAGALDDWETSGVREELRLALGFVQQLTRDPESVGPEHVRRLEAAGLTEDEIGTAVHIVAQFCAINRIADAMGFQVPSAVAFGRMGAALLKHGYRV